MKKFQNYNNLKTRKDEKRENSYKKKKVESK